MNTMEHEFYKFMKFDASLLYDRYSFYLKFFKDCKNVLDLGSGKGEFLELIRKEGKSGLGVDNDKEMTRVCEGKGLEVIYKDVFFFLKDTEKKFDGIFCAHLIEHLQHERVIELLSLCLKVLEQNGVLVIVTPNPSALHTQLHEFWRDPTHERMYSRELLEFLIYHTGFTVIESGENPKNRIPPPIDLDLFKPKAFEKIPHIAPAVTSNDRIDAINKNLTDQMNDRIDAINKNFETIRNDVNTSFQNIKELINYYYPPNEVYVVGRKTK